MITEHRTPTVSWIDVENPTQEDIDILIRDYQAHPLAAQELLVRSERSGVDVYEDSIYTALHYPDHPAHDMASESEFEVDYIIQRNRLITVHYGPVDLFLEFSKTLEVDAALSRQHDYGTGAHLFFHLNNILYRGLIEELEYIRKRVKKIESEIFVGKELKMVEEISILQRKLIDFRQAIRSHGAVLASFESSARSLFGDSFSVDRQEIHEEFLRVEAFLQNEREILMELRETNDSLLTSKSNDIIKRFTLMAFFTFPLALVVAVMGLHNAPEALHGPGGFWIIVATVVALFMAMYAYVVHRKWL